MKQGKLGAAVLGNHTTKEVGALLTGHLFEINLVPFDFRSNDTSIFLQYKLLLYLSQQKQVTTAKIHVGFVFTVGRNGHTDNLSNNL